MDKKDKKRPDHNNVPADDLDFLVDGSEEIGEILENLPEGQRKQVERLVIEQSFGMMGIGKFSPDNEVAKKITEEHITQYLDGSKQQMENSYKERHERKIFTVVLVALALVFFIAVIVLLKDNASVLEKIVYSVAGLIAGAFGGYGFGRQKRDDE